jgi:hypothetical protein
MGGGPILLNDVWAMLDDCAVGHTRRLHTHNYSIKWNGRLYRPPKGAHGRANPQIERSHVRRLVKYFSLQDCARAHLQI